MAINNWCATPPTKSGHNPLITIGDPGEFDDTDVYAPYILQDDDEILLYYSGNAGAQVITTGLAISYDGINFTKYGQVLDVGASGTWDDLKAHDVSVMKEGSNYKMWYSGTRSPEATYGLKIGYATSSDGRTWNKDAGNPVFDKGAGGEWDDVHVVYPCVIKEDSTYYMWYSGHDGGAYQGIGLATSSDGINWTREATNPVISGTSLYQGQCLKVGTTYYMIYRKATPGEIYLQTSTDKINWSGECKILTMGSGGEWDDYTLQTPCFYDNDCMYYAGKQNGGNYKIGVAADIGWQTGLSYYVDFTGGNDSNGGLSPGTAWKTISKVNNSNFNEGSSIYFKKGEIWREQLTIPDSGTSSNLITFSSYGSGNAPIINGSDLITGWIEDTGSGTYYPAESADDCRVYYNGSTGLLHNVVDCRFGNASALMRDSGFRFSNVTVPKNANIQTAFVRLTSWNSESGTTCNVTVKGEQNATPAVFSTYADYTGRTPTSATVAWNGIGAWTDGTQYDTPSITSIISEITSLSGWSSGNNLAIFLVDNSSSAGASRVASSYDYESAAEKAELHITWGSGADIWRATCTTEPEEVFFDKTKGIKETAIGNLNAEYEWFWASNVLYVYSTSDPDTAYTNPGIEAAQRNQSIDPNGKEYIVINGLHIKYTNRDGIYDNPSSSLTNIVIQNCEIEYCHRYGILYAVSGAGTTLTNLDINNNAIHHNGYTDAVDNWGYGMFIYAQKNEGIVNAQIYSNITQYNWNEGIRLDDGDSQCCIYQNTCYRDGDYLSLGAYTSASIMLGGGANGVSVYRNWLEGSAGEGIFVGSSSGTTGGHKIYYNIIKDVGDFGVAIARYDNDCKIYNNVIYNTYGGIILGNASQVTGTVIKNNIFSAMQGGIENISLKNSSTCTSDYNCFHASTFDIGGVNKTWAQWQALGYDTNSIYGSDPLFTDPANDDFSLQSNSPCIDAGTDVGLTRDYYGHNVPD